MKYEEFKIAFLELEKELKKAPSIRQLHERLGSGSFSTLSNFVKQILLERQAKEKIENKEILSNDHGKEIKNKIEEIFKITNDFLSVDYQNKINNLLNVISSQAEQIVLLKVSLDEMASTIDSKEDTILNTLKLLDSANEEVKSLKLELEKAYSDKEELEKEIELLKSKKRVKKKVETITDDRNVVIV